MLSHVPCRDMGNRDIGRLGLILLVCFIRLEAVLSPPGRGRGGYKIEPQPPEEKVKLWHIHSVPFMSLERT